MQLTLQVTHPPQLYVGWLDIYDNKTSHLFPSAPPGIGVRPTEETEVDVDVVGQGDEEDARECSQHEGKGPSNSVDHKSQQVRDGAVLQSQPVGY